MSILLDALKKSEEQRHLGKTPDVHAPSDHDPDEGKRKTRAWVPAAMMGVAAVLIFWFTWTQYREPEVPVVPEEPVVAKRVPGMTSGQAVAPGAARAERTPVETFTAPEEQAAPDATPGAEAEDPARTEVARQFNQFQRPTPAGESAQRQAQSSFAATKPQPEPQSRQPGEPSPATVPRKMDPVGYWELPQNVRDGMPEFRITVMVYADEPADRFMLVNGQRLKEKESLDGVELEEIRRDGAIFRYRNYRFLVKG